MASEHVLRIKAILDTTQLKSELNNIKNNNQIVKKQSNVAQFPSVSYIGTNNGMDGSYLNIMLIQGQSKMQNDFLDAITKSFPLNREKTSYSTHKINLEDVRKITNYSFLNTNFKTVNENTKQLSNTTKEATKQLSNSTKEATKQVNAFSNSLKNIDRFTTFWASRELINKLIPRQQATTKPLSFRDMLGNSFGSGMDLGATAYMFSKNLPLAFGMAAFGVGNSIYGDIKQNRKIQEEKKQELQRSYEDFVKKAEFDDATKEAINIYNKKGDTSKVVEVLTNAKLIIDEATAKYNEEYEAQKKRDKVGQATFTVYQKAYKTAQDDLDKAIEKNQPIIDLMQQILNTEEAKQKRNFSIQKFYDDEQKIKEYNTAVESGNIGYLEKLLGEEQLKLDEMTNSRSSDTDSYREIKGKVESIQNDIAVVKAQFEIKQAQAAVEKEQKENTAFRWQIWSWMENNNFKELEATQKELKNALNKSVEAKDYDNAEKFDTKLGYVEGALLQIKKDDETKLKNNRPQLDVLADINRFGGSTNSGSGPFAFLYNQYKEQKKQTVYLRRIATNGVASTYE